ncbi:probable E3 ubiquitin-protein ligase rnf217 [Phtheirospermum japonicum]|uniref:RBR-type E3 ubiquitin transferase n=1 Tax=Phtheirospermum japonicum TaxID=374723 RepID=A0A830C1N5_9LAMI|nr:probable E3 ubiquitin-protein ligase rnf217 [Phtheirospermum japonicum]
MSSVAIRPFASLKWPSALKLPDGVRVSANCRALVTLYHQFSSFFRKKKFKEPIMPAVEVKEESPDGMPLGPRDEYGELGTIDDAAYAEEIQFRETLMASIFKSKISNNPSSSPQNPTVHNEPTKLDNDIDQKSFCEICLENKDIWQMFANDTCSHSFCYECTSAHISVKIQDQAKEIACPAVNCHHVLNRDECRLMISNDTLVQWDESLCMSLIPESQKLYCPFRDCSAMLVNDSGETVTQIHCLVCSRAFCAECRVPWHSEFSCKEFQKLNGGKRGEDDKIVRVLAKKKNWQKCPKCKMYVEKVEGCVHITCRCSYEFCYRCGGKWTGSHGICPRPRWWISFRGNK